MLAGYSLKGLGFWTNKGEKLLAICPPGNGLGPRAQVGEVNLMLAASRAASNRDACR